MAASASTPDQVPGFHPFVPPAGEEVITEEYLGNQLNYPITPDLYNALNEWLMTLVHEGVDPSEIPKHYWAAWIDYTVADREADVRIFRNAVQRFEKHFHGKPPPPITAQRLTEQLSMYYYQYEQCCYQLLMARRNLRSFAVSIGLWGWDRKYNAEVVMHVRAQSSSGRP